MALQTQRRIQDGQLTFERGEDTGRSPTRIGRNQLALLINGTCRDDNIRQRPALIQADLIFESGGTQSNFEDGYFQGFHRFTHPGNDDTLLFSISGRIFECILFPTFTVMERALPAGTTNPTNRPLVWWEQVENTVVWQDGQSDPLLIGTGSIEKSDVQGLGGAVDGRPKKQVPTGRAMAYVNGRLWVTLTDGVSFVAGDIVGGPTGPLYFTENQFVNEGGAFKVPSNLGPIRAIRGIAELDTSLGQGPVVLLTTNGGFTCNAPTDRTTWKDVRNPINTVSLIRNGALSDGGTVPVNSDIWYRSSDGIRSFIVARRDFGMWGNSPLSHEVEKHLDDDSEGLLDRNSGTLWKSWLLETCQPQFDQIHGVYHAGLLALDFTPITAIGQRDDNPAWDGMWTGRKFMAVTTATIQGEERCFAVVLSDAGKIQLWELRIDRHFDEDADGQRLRIKTVIETPRFDFQDRTEGKTLEGLDIWSNAVRERVDFDLFFRQDQQPCWVPWQSWQLCAKTERCAADAVDGCVTDLNLRPQARPRTSAQRPPETCDTGTGTPPTFGYEFQARLEFTGSCEVNAIRLFAQKVAEDQFGACPPEEVTECPESVCCGPDNVVLSEALP